jgi:hypothetical protein
MLQSAGRTGIRKAHRPVQRMDLTAYRGSDREQGRIRDLMGHVPEKGGKALDIGARDGYLSLQLAKLFASVTALDLERPVIEHARVQCVSGDVCALSLPDNAFDLVLCAEVLEHIPPASLALACAEISRVARDLVLIGVPYRQDIRKSRTTCAACGGKNPPWGHVNSFDEKRLKALFPGLKVENITYVGRNRCRTNFISAWLQDLAGNPYGTYGQEEPCLHCGAKLVAAERRGFAGKAAGKLAHWIERAQGLFVREHASWIHILFRKPA